MKKKQVSVWNLNYLWLSYGVNYSLLGPVNYFVRTQYTMA